MENHFEHKYKREYDTIDNLVEAAVFYEIVQREDKDTIIAYIKDLYRDEYHYEPTDIRVDENEDGITVRVPFTLLALKGILEQRDKEVRYIKNKYNPSENEPQQVNNDNTKSELNLPIELDTEKAKALLQKLIDGGFCDEAYKWNKTKALLAYFADKASEYLDLGKGQLSDGRKKIAWKPFEALFLINKSGKWIKAKGLSLARSDYQKTAVLPDNSKDIDKLF